ncbi:hypothetical protein ZWY2020_031073 [Hordeum vulgare]|nr:hypothetical protein ZWY2020_031073 [Hordeum vulgare]
METQQQQRRHQPGRPWTRSSPRRQLPLGLLAAAVVRRAGRHHHLHDTPPAAPCGGGALSVLRRLALLATQAFISSSSRSFRSRPRRHPRSPLRCRRRCAGTARARGPPPWRPPAWSARSGTCSGWRPGCQWPPASTSSCGAERLLDENNVGARVAAVTCAALAGAFERTLRQLEASAGGEWGPPGMELAVRAVRSGVRWWRPTVAALEGSDAFGGPAAETLAAELLWLGQKMAECGAAREAAVQFGAASRLGSRALVAEPTLQVALLRLAVFLFRHANSAEFEQEEGKAEHRMAMLRSWLLLLPRQQRDGRAGAERQGEGGDGDGAGGADREAAVGAAGGGPGAVAAPLRRLPDTDWPNLERCYTWWYAESRKLLG